MSKIEKNAKLRREQDILDRLDNVKRLIQMEYTLMTSDGCGQYMRYKNYDSKGASFGSDLLDDLRDSIQLQLLSIVALCYGDNPDVGEPVPMLEWRIGATDAFRTAWDECLEWNA